MSMDKYIVRDADGTVVGKYEQGHEPATPEGGSAEQVDDLDEYEVVEWWE